MLRKGRVAMTPDELTGAARNLALGSASRSTFGMVRSTSRGRASRSYHQVVPAQPRQALTPLKKKGRTTRNESEPGSR